MSEKEIITSAKQSLWTRLRGVLDGISYVETLSINSVQAAEEARGSAKGLNFAVVELAETYRKAASQQGIGSFSRSYRAEDKKRLHPINMWSVLIAADKRQNAKGLLVVDKLPALLLQTESVAVSSLSVFLSSGEKGVSTIFWINKPENLIHQNLDPYKKIEFGNAVRVDIGPEGEVSFSREADKISGYTPVSYTESNLTGFIEQVQATLPSQL